MKSLLIGRPFGIPPKALEHMGKTNPELKQIAALLRRAPDTLAERRAIVRKMQIHNLLTK